MKKALSFLLVALLAFAGAGAVAEANLNSFTTTDMEGNEVTEAIFADYDLTMVNVWATWCGYCLQEMPEFAGLKDGLPENVNLITICDDAASEPELTAQILSESGANFTTLVANTELYDALLNYVVGFPTTYFVDSQGNLVGEEVVGVPDLANPKEAYMNLINTHLALVATEKALAQETERTQEAAAEGTLIKGCICE